MMDGFFESTRKEAIMSRTLKWIDHVLRKSRIALSAQQPGQAVDLLDRLVGAPGLDEQSRFEILEQLSEAYLMLRDWRRARKAFRQALRLRPHSGWVYQRLARAIASDPSVDARRASRYYRMAVQLSPDDVALLCEAGKYFADMRRWKRSLCCLQRAVDLAPEDFGVLVTLVEVLCQAERFQEAHRTLRVSQFRHRGRLRLHQLRDAVECFQLRHRQHSGRTESHTDVIPYVRLAHEAEESVRRKHWRRDAAGRVARPHLDFQRFFRDHGRSG